MQKNFQSRPIPRFRRGIMEYLDVVRKFNTIYSLVDLDVTELRKTIRRYRKATGSSLSISTYLIYLFARSLENYKDLLSYRQRNNLIFFDDIDMNTLVEKKINGELTTSSYIIRQADKKGLQEIQEELDAAKNDSGDTAFSSGDKKNTRAIFARLPGLLRKLILNIVLRQNPHLRKKMFGTVALSALHMYSIGMTGFGIPMTPHALNLLTSSLCRKPVVVGNSIEIREMLGVTLSMNHDVVDGARSIRLVQEIKSNLEALIGLEDYKI